MSSLTQESVSDSHGDDVPSCPPELFNSEIPLDQELLFQILNAMPIGVLLALPRGRTYYANDEAVRLLGRQVDPTAEIHQLSDVYELYKEGGRERYPTTELVVKAIAGSTSHVDDLEVHQPEGQVIPLELWSTPVFAPDSSVRFGIVAFADVSDRKRAERTLKEQAALLALSYDAVIVWNRDRHITYWNKGSESLYGYSRDEAIGRNISELLDTRGPEMNSVVAQVLEGRAWDGELLQRRSNGNRLAVDSRMTPDRGADGLVVGALEINRDVTARKTAEEELAKRLDELERTTLELRISNSDLEQFAYVASHDLSEPLRAISGPVALLARRYEDKLDDKAHRYIEFAVDGCDRMQKMIDDLLAFSRVARVELPMVAVDFNRVAAGVLDSLAATIRNLDASVQVGDLPIVLAEPSQLSQVFQNLVSNSLKFVSPGVRPQVWVTADRLGGTWRFAVCDNGIGVAPEYRERIFGMFKRLHGREEYPGTGIGLAVVKKIIERHSGEIGVEDGPEGQGSCFWFTLPAKEMDL